jgi:hypothetical protein
MEVIKPIGTGSRNFTGSFGMIFVWVEEIPGTVISKPGLFVISTATFDPGGAPYSLLGGCAEGAIGGVPY